MWKAIDRECADQFGNIARCTVELWMRQQRIDPAEAEATEDCLSDNTMADVQLRN